MEERALELKAEVLKGPSPADPFENPGVPPGRGKVHL